MSRVSKSLKNAKIGAFFFLISIFAQFFTRKIFLDFLGDEFIGLTSTLRSVLGFLNLAELGIGTAIGYALYKPIFDGDEDEINKIIALLGILYKKIGLFILSVGVIISLFFPYFLGDTPFSPGLIYFIFYSFLTSTLISYFFNYHMTLLEADQRGYVVQVYFQTISVLRLIFQALIAYYLQSYYAWVIMELIFSIILSVILRKKIKEHYPWLIIASKETTTLIKKYPDIIKKTKQLFVHKMGSFVKDGTDNILVYALVNLQSVAFFGNYQLIFMNLISLINVIFAGTGAGVGNLVAENDKKNIDKVFWEMMALQFFIAGFFSIAVYYLVSPFVILWIGEEYVLGEFIIILMIGNFFISLIRSPVQHFQNAYGLFSDTWAPALEIVINLVVSLIFGKLWGISGIMLGTFSSLIVIVMLWKPYLLYSKGFESSIWIYWKGFIQLIIIFIITAFIVNFLYVNYFVHESSTFIAWCLNAIKLSIITLAVYGSLMYLSSQGFRHVYSRLFQLVQNMIRRN
ncbi:MAG: O-antigen/teichoic acid export membrane protein [Polaribacter sp.]|jgi:O-antigen/teichoic acid export membrane protein